MSIFLHSPALSSSPSPPLAHPPGPRLVIDVGRPGALWPVGPGVGHDDEAVPAKLEAASAGPVLILDPARGRGLGPDLVLVVLEVVLAEL